MKRQGGQESERRRNIDIIPLEKKKKAEISEKMSTSDGCGGENVSQIGALVVQMEKTRKEASTGDGSVSPV